MATDVGSAKTTTATRYETFVGEQLAKAEARIRSLDVLAGVLGLVAGALAFGLVVIACDQFGLSVGVRQLLLAIFAVLAAIYASFTIGRPLSRRVNPYYAARHLERTLPNAKNSVVNYLDMRESPPPAAIRSAVGQRAARDLAKADVDRAISGRRVQHAGGLAGLLAVAFLVAAWMLGPTVLFSHLGRAFLPLSDAPPPQRTTLAMVEPEGGDAVATMGRPVTIKVRVGGTLPETVRLQMRYQSSDPYQSRPLAQDAGDSRLWTITLSAFDVRDGFWYRVSGGDAQTDEYQIKVRAVPLIEQFAVTYKHPAYAGLPDAVSRARKLEALRGTEVEIFVRGNGEVRGGAIELDVPSRNVPVKGEPVPGEPDAFRARFVLDESGTYRVAFSTPDGEHYRDASSHTVTALPDKAPEVVITSPEDAVAVAVNGRLKIEGKATDDVGVKSVALHLEVVNGTRLQPRPYRSDKELRLPTGGYPMTLAYKDHMDLTQVRDAAGQPVKLEEGMELEAWLEAKDACGPPGPNVGLSNRVRVKLTAPEQNAARQQQNKQRADQEKGKHDQQQDDQLKKEDQGRKDAQKQADKDKKEAEKKNDGKEGDKGDEGEGKAGGDKKSEGKDGEGKPTDKKDEGKDGKPGDKAGEGTKPPEKDPKLKEKEDRLNQALNEQKHAGKDDKGEAKPDTKQENKPGEGKDGGKPDNEKKPEAGEGKGASARPEEGKDAGKEAGEPKDAGKPGEDKPAAQKDAKPDGKPEEKAGAKDNPDPQKGEKPAEGKNGGQDQKGGKEQQGGGSEAKGAGGGEGAKTAAEKKDAGGKDGGADQIPQGQQGEGKPAPKEPGKEGKGSDGKPMAEGKDRAPEAGKDGGKSEGKDAGKPGSPQAQPKGEAKPDDRKDGGTRRGDAKPDVGKDRSAGGKGAKSDPKEASRQDVEQTARDLNDKLGGDPKQKADAAKKLKEQMQNLEKQAREGKDEQTRADAQQKLDQMKKDMRDEGRKMADQMRQLEKIKNEAKDADAREAADKALKDVEKKLDDARREAREQGAGEEGLPRDPKEAKPEDVEKTAKDLKDQLGKDSKQRAEDVRQRREQMRQLEKQANQDADPKARDDAQKKLDEMKKEAGERAADAKGKLDELKDARDKARDPAAREAAKKALDDLEQKADEAAKEEGDLARGGRPDPKEAKPDDVERMAKDVKDQMGGDPKKRAEQARKAEEEMRDLERKANDAADPKAREEARDKLDKMQKEMEGNARDLAQQVKNLQDIKDNATDPKAREEAARQLEEIAKELKKIEDEARNVGTGGPKQPPKPDAADGKGPSKEKDGKPQPGKDTGEAKDGGKNGEPKADAKDQPPPMPGKPDVPPQGEGKDKFGPPDKPPFVPADDGRPDKVTKPDNDPADPRDRKRAAELQLENWRKKINKDTLEKAGLTEKDLDDIVKAKRAQLEKDAGEPEVLPGPQPGTLPSTGGSRTKPAGTGEDVRGAATGQPPPGYRDAAAEFRKLLNKDDKDKK